MPRYCKTRDELLTELMEQMSALRASAQSYDGGHLWEAKRLASAAYILVHDSPRGRARSLLSQLGLRSSLECISSISAPVAERSHSGWDSSHGLLFVTLHNREARFTPKLGKGAESYRNIPFLSWYDEVIFYGLRNASVSRKNLIHYLRSQDGGAHVDPTLDDPHYHDWKAYGDPGLSFEQSGDGLMLYGPTFNVETGETIYDPNPGLPVRGSVFAAMRQIAWELESSISRLGF